MAQYLPSPTTCTSPRRSASVHTHRIAHACNLPSFLDCTSVRYRHIGMYNAFFTHTRARISKAAGLARGKVEIVWNPSEIIERENRDNNDAGLYATRALPLRRAAQTPLLSARRAAGQATPLRARRAHACHVLAISSVRPIIAKGRRAGRSVSTLVRTGPTTRPYAHGVWAGKMTHRCRSC